MVVVSIFATEGVRVCPQPAPLEICLKIQKTSVINIDSRMRKTQEIQQNAKE
jgi:hypothetical protein